MGAADSFPRRQALTRRFTLGEPRDIRVSGDGARVAFLRSGGPVDSVNALWVLDVATGVERLVADPRRLGGGRGDAHLPPAERARRERVRETGAGIVSYDADESLTMAVFALGGELWCAGLDEGGPGPQALDAQPAAFDPRLAPDGARVAYVAGSDLWVTAAGVSSGVSADRLVARDPDPAVSWGTAEFVAAEEMGRTRGHWWSPDGRRLLAARVDNSPVGSWWIADPAAPGTPPVALRYPAAGTTNAEVALAVFDIGSLRAGSDSGSAHADGSEGVGSGGGAPACSGSHIVDLDGGRDSDGVGSGGGRGFGGVESEVAAEAVEVVWHDGGWEYLAGVRWNSDGLLLTVQTRDQRTLAVLEVDPDSGRCRLLRTVTDYSWVEIVPGVPRLVGDRLVTVEDRGPLEVPEPSPAQESSARTYSSDEDLEAERLVSAANKSGEHPVPARGARTRSRARLDGAARTLCVDGEPLTPATVQVRAVHHGDADGVVVTASADPAEVHVARVGWDGAIDWLTSMPGVHGAVVGGGTAVIASRSLSRSGRVCAVRSNRRSGSELIIESLAAEPGMDLDVEIVELGPRRLVSALLMPTGPAGAGDGPLPVLLDPYGGPHAQRVQRAEALFHTSQWFAEAGFAVLVTDGRGTPGRGPRFEREVRGDLAGPVLQDQIDALTAAARRFGRLDLTRVAIRGWSFGGYLAALGVLRRPDVFAAAIAGAPVTDWRLYDTHYTERYLGHPDTEPANYERTDLTPLAKGLARPLMLIHGLADDNVVAAHTLRLSQALTEAGRPHTVLPLSGVTHMTPQPEVAENLLLLQLRFLQDALAMPSGSVAPTTPQQR